MVDQTNLARAQMLIAQRQGYRQGLAILDMGGGIRAFVLQAGDGSSRDQPSYQTWIEATGINYPPQMLDAIRQQLTTRITEIESELAGMDVTGFDTGPPFPLTGHGAEQPITPAAAPRA